jgi:uncharacterized protein YdcH (DUF465 family)
MTIQLDLFINEVDLLKEENMKLRISSDNVRKGMFARHNVLEKRINEQEKTNEVLRNEVESLKDIIHSYLVKIA